MAGEPARRGRGPAAGILPVAGISRARLPGLSGAGSQRPRRVLAFKKRSLVRPWRRGGPVFALALVAAAAVASLFGPGPVQRMVGSVWFLAAAGAVAIAGLLAAVTAIRRHSWSRSLSENPRSPQRNGALVV